MGIYDEAAHPGSSRPQPFGSPNGTVIPPLHLRELPQKAAGIGRDFTAGSFTRSPQTTSGKPGQRPFPGEIVKSLPAIGPSVAGTVVNATPVSNVTAVVNDLPGIERRPIIPVGLRERAAELMPPGMRHRATAWTRTVARWRSNRPSSRNRVHRE